MIHDDPYKGGYSTGNYGKPSEGIHALQVEIARRLYMDERTLAKKANDFDVAREYSRALVARLGSLALA